MRILALVPGDVSEQILFFPALQALRERYPSAKIHAIVEPQAMAAYEVCASVDAVMPFGFKESLSLADLGDLLGRMRDTYYDVAIVLGDDAWLRFFVWLSGIPKRVGYRGKANFLLTDAIAPPSGQYAASAYCDLLQALGLSATSPLPQIRLKKVDLSWAERERDRLLGKTDRDYLLLYPGSEYPVSSWVKIAKIFFEKRPELPVVVIVGPEEEDVVEQFKADAPDLPVMRPAGVGEFAAAIAGASLLLAPDSAPLQLAVATQTPVVGLFGSSDPARELPAEGPFRAVRSNNGKLSSITAEQAIEAVFPS
ncbi:glycosyltransferase family 9 protein [Synechococcus sp. PCC 7336]|uniref:glycosyltransferase family 9 protein n=1 Tax=Synechococcus sp. PCC 7336 TaxID=195250 RepID=UPI00034C1231|nr:glycosyltransferase family 9 protein [Synechococcus sp. PCC 7336]